jgi:hypothetical protein
MKTVLPDFCRLAFLILVLLAGIDGVTAAEINSSLMVSGGGSFFPDRNLRDSSGTLHSATFKDRFQIGILATVDLHASFAIEAGFRGGRSGLRIKDGSLLPAGNTLDFSAQQFFCNAVYHTPYSGGGLRLFATGGAGLRRIAPAAGMAPDIGWSVNFGGGLEARPSRRFSIRAELRDFVGGMPRLVPSQSTSGLLHDIQPSIGLIIHLL